jgi:hypothetical protein
MDDWRIPTSAEAIGGVGWGRRLMSSEAAEMAEPDEMMMSWWWRRRRGVLFIGGR